MPKTGSAILPLHYGHPPERLFKRMIQLGGTLCELILEKYGSRDLLLRFSDPYWFHSIALATGFDWNSSGTTTVMLSALKEYFDSRNGEIVILGAKGKRLSTVKEQYSKAETKIGGKFLEEAFLTAKDVARVDNNLLQDTFDLYLQYLITDGRGWSIVQQGMNSNIRMARRYHWHSGVDRRLYDDARYGLSGTKRMDTVLDLSTSTSSKNRDGMIDIIKDRPERYRGIIGNGRQRTLDMRDAEGKILDMDVRVDWKKLQSIYEDAPSGFNELYRMKGIGKSTLRALSYLSEIVYGSEPSFKDPIKFSFALGGKDGIPKPVNYKDYDTSIAFFREVLGKPGFDGTIDAIIRNLSRSGLIIR